MGKLLQFRPKSAVVVDASLDTVVYRNIKKQKRLEKERIKRNKNVKLNRGLTNND